MRLKKYCFYVLLPGLGLLLIAGLTRWLAAATPPEEIVATKEPGAAGGKPREAETIAVAPPPFSEGIFPCSTCHDPKDKVNTAPRPLSFHDDIVFKHDEKNRWCLDCHDANNRDRLHLSGGRPVEFSQSYELCGQCHGPQLRDWKVGEHGKRSGSWSGRKEYLLCAHCHDPHAPKFKPLKPLPAPLFPEGLL